MGKGERSFVIVAGVHRRKAIRRLWDVKRWTWSPFIQVLLYRLQDGSPAGYNSQIIALSQQLKCILPTPFPFYPIDKVVAVRSFLFLHNIYGSNQNNSMSFSLKQVSDRTNAVYNGNIIMSETSKQPASRIVCWRYVRAACLFLSCPESFVYLQSAFSRNHYKILKCNVVM